MSQKKQFSDVYDEIISSAAQRERNVFIIRIRKKNSLSRKYCVPFNLNTRESFTIEILCWPTFILQPDL